MLLAPAKMQAFHASLFILVSVLFSEGNTSPNPYPRGPDAAVDCTCAGSIVQVCTRNEELREELCSRSSGVNYTGNSGTSQLKWVDLDLGQIPRDAIIGGYHQWDLNDYILLAPYGGGTHIGKLTEKLDGSGALEAKVSHDGEEVTVTSYLVLTGPHGSYSWFVTRKNQALPEGAVRAGRDPHTGSSYHVGRGGLNNSTLVPGKIHGTTLYTPYWCEEKITK